MLARLICFSIIVQIAASQVSFVAVGVNIVVGNNKSIAYSVDGGLSWSLVAQDIFSKLGSDVAYSAFQNKWIAVGEGIANTIAWSPDGITWTGLGKNLFSAGNGVAYSAQQNKWVAVGTSPNSIHYSNDGFVWTAVTPNIFTTMGYDVTYSSTLNQWVAVGQGTNTIAVSADGITWTGLGAIVFSTMGMSVNYANGFYVASGWGSFTQAWSADGVSWTETSEFISNMRHDTVYAEGRWLLVGRGPVNFQNSTNGKAWSNQVNPLNVSDIYGITYNAGYDRYVAVGYKNTTMLYSSDGINWTPATGGFDYYGWRVATTGVVTQTIVNPTPITSNIVNLVANTSIINSNLTVSVSGNLTVVGDLAIDGSWLLANSSRVNVTGLLEIKGNTTFNSQKSINCQSLSISSAIGDSQLEVALNVNLAVGASVAYPVITYVTQSGTFNAIKVRSASTIVLAANDCPVVSQSYSSTTLTVTVMMTACDPNLVEVASQNLPMGVIIGIAVGCAVLAAAVILVVILLMRRHRDRLDAVANSHIREASINDLKVSTIKPNAVFQP